MFNWVSNTPLIVNPISRRNNYLYFVDSFVIQNATFKLKHWKIDLPLFLFFPSFLHGVATDWNWRLVQIFCACQVVLSDSSCISVLLQRFIRTWLDRVSKWQILKEPSIVRLCLSHLSKHESKISSILTHFSSVLRFI